jgi:hypothetical protein
LPRSLSPRSQRMGLSPPSGVTRAWSIRRRLASRRRRSRRAEDVQSLTSLRCAERRPLHRRSHRSTPTPLARADARASASAAHPQCHPNPFARPPSGSVRPPVAPCREAATDRSITKARTHLAPLRGASTSAPPTTSPGTDLEPPISSRVLTPAHRPLIRTRRAIHTSSPAHPGSLLIHPAREQSPARGTPTLARRRHRPFAKG